MPKFRIEPPVSGIFVPDMGSYQADADGVFDLPASAAVEKACADMNLKLIEVAEEAPPKTEGEGETKPKTEGEGETKPKTGGKKAD